MALTAWNYMWRSTPLHRSEASASVRVADHAPPAYPDGVTDNQVLHGTHGHGDLFHRRYRVRIRTPKLSAEALMAQIQANVNRASPTLFARFQKVVGERDVMRVGDEYVVRMPGPWDGPVRVISVTDLTFRLATLAGHLEAGQIEFRCHKSADGLVFEIESWARSSDFFSYLLYQRLRMAKETQLHMWLSFLERAVRLAGGRMTGGVRIETFRVGDFPREP